MTSERRVRESRTWLMSSRVLRPPKKSQSPPFSRPRPKVTPQFLVSRSQKSNYQAHAITEVPCSNPAMSISRLRLHYQKPFQKTCQLLCERWLEFDHKFHFRRPSQWRHGCCDDDPIEPNTTPKQSILFQANPTTSAVVAELMQKRPHEPKNS